MHSKTNEVDVETAKKFNLDKENFQDIKKFLARTPNYYELAIIASICHSGLFDERIVQWLYSLPITGKKIVEKNRKRKVDLGEGNLYSLQLELGPYSSLISGLGNPAGVYGNAQRKLMAQKSRIVASLNDIRFGDLNQQREQEFLRNTINSLSEYSNNFGIPLVGGELHFQDSYNNKPFINILSLGLEKPSKERGNNTIKEGDLLFIAGSPSISQYYKQNDNAFLERLLTDACTEALAKKELEYAGPIAQGGITANLLLLLRKSNLGALIELDTLTDDHTISSFLEVLPSEHSSRMLLIASPDQYDNLVSTFDKWEVELEPIGIIGGDENKIQYSFQGEVQVELSVGSIIEIAERFKGHTKEQRKAPRQEKANKFNIKKVSYSKNYKKIANKILSSSNVAAKQWILDQFDNTIKNHSISANFPTSAAVLKIPDSKKLLALSFDGNPKYVNSDPFSGAMIAVAEATRNIIISGGYPIAMTLGLCVGDPKDPVVNWQLNQVIRGINEASRKLGVAILDLKTRYIKDANPKKNKEGLMPSPIIGMLGVIEDAHKVVGIGFKEEGHLIYMIGTPHSDINSSEYLTLVHNNPASPAPVFDLDEEYHIQQHIRKLIRRNMIVSAHDIMEGGLFACLIGCGGVNNYGFSIESDSNFRKDAYLFGESQSRIIVSIRSEKEDEFVNYLNAQNVPFTRLGEVGGENALIDEEDFGTIEKWKNITQQRLLEVIS